MARRAAANGEHAQRAGAARVHWMASGSRRDGMKMGWSGGHLTRHHTAPRVGRHGSQHGCSNDDRTGRRSGLAPARSLGSAGLTACACVAWSETLYSPAPPWVRALAVEPGLSSASAHHRHSVPCSSVPSSRMCPRTPASLAHPQSRRQGMSPRCLCCAAGVHAVSMVCCRAAIFRPSTTPQILISHRALARPRPLVGCDLASLPHSSPSTVPGLPGTLQLHSPTLHLAYTALIDTSVPVAHQETPT
jgi:hypothetical protein